MNESSPCPFCQIAKGLDPHTAPLWRSAGLMLFQPLEPATKGHLLLAPRTHVPNIFDVSQALAEDLATTTVRVARAAAAVLQPPGLNIIQSNGMAATQTVMHVHVHVLPRWNDDDMVLRWPKVGHKSTDDWTCRLLSRLGAA